VSNARTLRAIIHTYNNNIKGRRHRKRNGKESKELHVNMTAPIAAQSYGVGTAAHGVGWVQGALQ
jgi:hypothetical protein